MVPANGASHSGMPRTNVNQGLQRMANLAACFCLELGGKGARGHRIQAAVKPS